MGTWAEKRQKELGIEVSDINVVSADLKVLDEHLADTGILDEKLLDEARSVFTRSRRSERARGLNNPVEVAARRITQQVKGIWDRELKARGTGTE